MKVIETSISIVNGIREYTTKCPKCHKIFLPKFGVSVCTNCSIRTPHPSDMYWNLRDRIYYHSAWNSFYVT